MFKGKDMYEMCDDVPDNDEMNRMIDEERMDEYRQADWTCKCGCKFNVEEAVEGDGNVVGCPACGEEIEMDDEYWYR